MVESSKYFSVLVEIILRHLCGQLSPVIWCAFSAKHKQMKEKSGLIWEQFFAILLLIWCYFMLHNSHIATVWRYPVLFSFLLHFLALFLLRIFTTCNFKRLKIMQCFLCTPNEWCLSVGQLFGASINGQRIKDGIKWGQCVPTIKRFRSFYFSCFRSLWCFPFACVRVVFQMHGSHLLFSLLL